MKHVLYLIVFFVLCQKATAQSKAIRIGVFASLYLDSTFDNRGDFKIKNSFPKTSVSGLEFYEGAAMAVDSLNKSGIPVTMEVFDIQSKNGNTGSLMGKGKFDSLDIMIGAVSGTDFLQLATIAKNKKIPLISATYPNDGGIESNPMVYIANPKISSHIELIFNQIQNRWANANVIWMRENNASDQFLESLFKESFQKAGSKTTVQYIALNRPIENQDITKWVDTTKNNVFIVGSLDDGFSVEALKLIESYPKKGIVSIVGMPNWESLREIQLRQYSGIPVYYTTGFFIPSTHEWANSFDTYFKNIFFTKASISAYKGFELTFYFSNILSKFGRLEQVTENDMSFKVLNDFQFKPVRHSADAEQPDYFENKRIYFIRRLNNVISLQ